MIKLNKRRIEENENELDMFDLKSNIGKKKTPLPGILCAINDIRKFQQMSIIKERPREQDMQFNQISSNKKWTCSSSLKVSPASFEKDYLEMKHENQMLSGGIRESLSQVFQILLSNSMMGNQWYEFNFEIIFTDKFPYQCPNVYLRSMKTFRSLSQHHPLKIY